MELKFWEDLFSKLPISKRTGPNRTIIQENFDDPTITFHNKEVMRKKFQTHIIIIIYSREKNPLVINLQLYPYLEQYPHLESRTILKHLG